MALYDLNSLSSRVAARYWTEELLKKAAFSMDMFARLSILEGAAGVSPGKWLNRGAAGFGKALDHFGPHLAASWTTTRNEGVYDKALAAAARVLSGTSQMDAADLVQDLVIGSTKSSSKARERVFYTVGEKLRSHENDLGAGDITPRDGRVLGTLERWVRRAALDVVQSSKVQKTQPFAPGMSENFDPTRTMRVELTPEKHQALMLLALQSPGGPGRDLRRAVDRLVQQTFPKKSRSLVRLFIQKISEPKYRSPSKMKELIGKFHPERWFSQAVNLVRKEIMNETGASPQQLTNVLGPKARKVLKFMREKVGRDPFVKKILDSLTQDIYLAEPGIARVAKPSLKKLPLRDLEGLLNDIFEKDEHLDWDAQTGPHIVYNRGPVELRVAQRFLLADLRPTNTPTSGQEKHKPGDVWQTDAGNWRAMNPQGVAKSFAQNREQAEQYARPQQDPSEAASSQKSEQKEEQWVSPVQKAEEDALTSWLGDQDEKTLQKWKEGDGKDRAELKKQFEKDREKPTQLKTEQTRARESRFKKWLGEQPTETQKAWETGNRDKKIEVRQQFSSKEREKQKTQEAEVQRKREEKNKPDMSQKDFMSTPKASRPKKWVSTENDNLLYGPSAEVGNQAELSKTKVSGSVKGKAKAQKSEVHGEVLDNAELESTTVEKGAVVSGSSKLKRVEVGAKARVRGNTTISNAKITGGSWDGQKIENGYGGVFTDAYDQKTLNALTSLKKPGVGDSPLRAISHYLADGGRTKGWFGGELNRKQLQKRVKEHIYEKYDRKQPDLGRGAGFLSKLSEEDFNTVFETAQQKASEMKPRSKKAHFAQNRHMLYELTKAAYERPHLRLALAPLIRLGHSARVASVSLDLRGIAIRLAYNTQDRELRTAVLKAIVSSEKTAGLSKIAQRRAPRYRQAFLRWVQNRKFDNPNPDGRLDKISFFSLPPDEQKRIYQEWQQNRLDWARDRYMPPGLSSDTKLNLDNFDQVKPGDILWASMSPVHLLRVEEIDRSGWRERNPTLVLQQVDRETLQDVGGTRHLTKSSLNNEMLEYHKVPGVGRNAERERAKAQLPSKPREGWPKFDRLGLGGERERRLQETFQDMVNVRDPREISLGRIKDRLENALGEAPPPRKAVKEFLHQLRAWVSELEKSARSFGDLLEPEKRIYGAMKLKIDQGISKLDGADRQDRQHEKALKERYTPSLRNTYGEVLTSEDLSKMEKVFGREIRKLAQEPEAVLDPERMESIFDTLKNQGVARGDLRRKAYIALALKRAMRQVMTRLDSRSLERSRLDRLSAQASRHARNFARRFQGEQREQRVEEEARRREPPRHQGRERLQGGGHKQMDRSARLPGSFITKILPRHLSAENKAEVRRQLKSATYAQLEKLRKSAAYILKNPEAEWSKNHPLVSDLKYKTQDLKALKKMLGRKMSDVQGRQYHEEVLGVANKYDLESEDADALYNFELHLSTRHRGMSDQEKFQKFLAKAKPETKERMKDMTLEDFLKMQNAIFKDGASSPTAQAA